MASKNTWTEERVGMLVSFVTDGVAVTQEQLKEIAEAMDTTNRSIGSKLRKLGYEVEKAVSTSSRSWSDAEESELVAFLEANGGVYTYAEISAAIVGGKFSPKQVQGKILSLEMTDKVRPAEKVEVVRKYSPDEEAIFLQMAESGASIEAIAEALDRDIKSIRGKALSFIRSIEGFKMPAQSETHAVTKVDPWDELTIDTMTVAEIATALGKTERGVKTALTRRQLICKDYDGAAKAVKAAKARSTED